ncbi:hypothetical protein VW35_04635 [Devosia soli]|uniref:Glycosyl transferase family 25 domain-containing protein n=1 Tax=Devosia soli TaxID=361041 RepID=A0A0F5LBR8_9HYPH|nr:hypothetical protein VW35_04635 [Devosia soli]
MLPIYYINLANRRDRRAFMENQFSRLQLSGTRIEAVTPADISAEDIDRFCNPLRPSFLRRNELACTLSHERCWQSMLDSGAERALVFEDDVRLASALPAFLKAVSQVDAELIRIDALGGTIRVYPPHAEAGGIRLRKFRSTPIGAAGYVISASAARKLLGDPDLRHRPVDLALYDPFDGPGARISRVLTDPALCQQVGELDQKVGQSNIVADGITHIYAQRHPLRHRASKLRTGIRRGLRNAVDHFAQQKLGLERRLIPMATEN